MRGVQPDQIEGINKLARATKPPYRDIIHSSGLCIDARPGISPS